MKAEFIYMFTNYQKIKREEETIGFQWGSVLQSQWKQYAMERVKDIKYGAYLVAESHLFKCDDMA